MDPTFWHDRWAAGQIGFHEAAPNPALLRHWDAFVPPGAHVLVPLCGKSLDLHWLVARGHRVTGVELSPIAVAAVFGEHGLEAERSSSPSHRVHRAGALTVLEGDFFAVEGRFDAFYDRAALIALPPALRPRYVAHLRGLLRPGAHGLLVSLDYPQAERAGPPFAVPDAEVRAHWPEARLRERLDLGDTPRVREWGLSRMHEAVWAVEVRGAEG